LFNCKIPSYNDKPPLKLPFPLSVVVAVGPPVTTNAVAAVAELLSDPVITVAPELLKLNVRAVVVVSPLTKFESVSTAPFSRLLYSVQPLPLPKLMFPVNVTE
jgi:hypothetical protein